MPRTRRKSRSPLSSLPESSASASAREQLREHASEAAQLMKALGHESRLLVLCTLLDGEMSVRQLNAQVPLSQSALSQHLAVLRREGLVTTRRSAQTIYYSLAEGPASRVIGVLHDIYCAE